MDTNYQAGLVWARQTQFRFIAHPNENLAFGVSLENPEQYLGGANGERISDLLPAAYRHSCAATQFNNGSRNELRRSEPSPRHRLQGCLRRPCR